MQTFDSSALGPDPREVRRAAWRAGVAPQAMLAALADTFDARDRTPSPEQARALRRFAVRCATQRLAGFAVPAGPVWRDEYMHARHLVDVAERMAAGTLPPREAEIVHRLSAAVAHGAAERLLDPEMRASAATLLAAFHALDGEPYAAALQSAGVMERHGAASEADAQRVRVEQVAWLRELFGEAAPVRPGPPPPAPVLGAWESTGDHVPEQVERMRHLLRFRAALLAIDPWIAVPQARCSFTFGSEEGPLPIGALCRLWDRWGAMRGQCPACGGRVVGYEVSAVSSTGGVIGCCVVCQRELRRLVGGIATLIEAMRPLLAGTPFVVGRPVLMRMVVGPAAAFDAAVGAVLTERMLDE